MINLDGKIIEVLLSNIRWNLPKPKVNSHLIYLSTTRPRLSILCQESGWKIPEYKKRNQ